MKYLKQHPSNLFEALGIVLGLVTAIVGALTNPFMLIAGIVTSITTAIALALSIRETIKADRETQRWQEINNLRIDLATEMATPGWAQDWQAFNKRHNMSELNH